jgi:hypothetical protein
MRFWTVEADRSQLDHYIIYHCHFELGKLYAARGDDTNARKNFETVMSGELASVDSCLDGMLTPQVKSQRASSTRKPTVNTH